MIEQNPVHAEQPVSLAIVHHHPERVDLRRAVRTSRIKRRDLRLRRFRCLSEHLGGRGLINLRPDLQLSNCFQQTRAPKSRDVAGVFGRVERNLDVALRAEVVDLVGIDEAKDPVQR